MSGMSRRSRTASPAAPSSAPSGPAPASGPTPASAPTTESSGSSTPLLDAVGLQNEALGQVEAFDAGNHGHRLWFEARDGGEVEAMVASSPTVATEELTRLVDVVQSAELLGDEWKAWALSAAREGFALLEQGEHETAKTLDGLLEDSETTQETLQARMSHVKPSYRLAYVFKELFEAEYNVEEMKNEPNAMHAVTFFQQKMYKVFGDLGVYQTEEEAMESVRPLLGDDEYGDVELAQHQTPHMLGAIVDEELNQAFFGMSAGGHEAENDYRQKTMHPAMDEVMLQVDHATEPWDISNCSEFEMANEALWQRSRDKGEQPGTTTLTSSFWERRAESDVMNLAKKRGEPGQKEAESSLRNPKFKPTSEVDPFENMRFAAAESKPNDDMQTKRRDPCLNCDRVYHVHAPKKKGDDKTEKPLDTSSKVYGSSQFGLDELGGDQVRALEDDIHALFKDSGYDKDPVAFLVAQADSTDKASVIDQACKREFGRYLKQKMQDLKSLLAGD